MNRGVSIAKWNDHVANEDSFFSSDTCIAVSDGAGGCGLFADEWSQYLIEQLPKNKPITSFTELDEWVDSIWESFYNEHEEKAKQGDGILLNKFYNEGSCATIAADGRFRKRSQNGWLMVIVLFSIIVFKLEFWNIVLRDWQISVILQDWLVVKTRWKKKALNMVNLF